MNLATRNESDIDPLQERIVELEGKLMKIEEALKVSKRRYEIAMSFSDVTVFDYDIKTKKILTQPEDFVIYGMPGVLEHGVEDVLQSGIIAEKSKDNLRELYRKIDEGAATANTIIYANDLSGGERTLEIQMVSILDKTGHPAYAVGVRKDITESMRFHTEKKYSELLTSELTLIFEANVTQDNIFKYNEQWALELGLKDVTSFSKLQGLMCEKFIMPEDTKFFLEKLSQKSIISTFQNGTRIMDFEYRRLVTGKNYLWFEAKINLVEDEITGDINMRVYIVNIDSKKKNELKMATERKQYEMAIAKSHIIYELNITKNTMSYIRNELGERYELFSGDFFNERILPRILNAIHPNEKGTVAALLSSTNILEAYANQGNPNCEYRRMDKQGQYNWFHCALQIFEDPRTKDIICYAYVEDINEEKEKEMELMYKAQHDVMTGLYNKKTTEEKIDFILSGEVEKLGTHIFFIIDLDYFKQINDNFGHAFGDAVLSQTSAKIKTLFRKGDVLGRIGGDEFAVFMKNIQDEKIAFLKAQELCDVIAEVYSKNGIEYKMTASVGIAVCNKHGKTYDELYRHSDTALYDAKERGRNRFSIYSEGMVMNKTSIREIDQRIALETKTFENNISEYVFRILYEAVDKRQAINSVLALIGKHYGVSHIYVFENSEDGTSALNTFRWCNPSIEGNTNKLERFSYSEFAGYDANFNKEGIFYVSDVETVLMPLRNILEEQNIKAMVQFPIVKNGKFAGVIGFDECVGLHMPESREISEYRNLANIISVFIVEMRMFEK